MSIPKPAADFINTQTPWKADKPGEKKPNRKDVPFDRHGTSGSYPISMVDTVIRIIKAVKDL